MNHIYTVGEEVRVLNGFRNAAYPGTVTDVTDEEGQTIISVYLENKDDVYRYDAETGLPYKLFETAEIKDKTHPPTLVPLGHELVPKLDAQRREKQDWVTIQVLLNNYRNEPNNDNMARLLTKLKEYHNSEDRKVLGN